MKKIKEFLGNKNIIIIMCVIVILGLSTALVISLNISNKKINTSNNNTETNIENKDENLSEQIEDENKDDKNKDNENKGNENKDDVASNNSKPSNSSNSQKNENQTNNSSSNKKENTTQKPTTENNSKKEETQTNNNSSNKTYICPSGYVLSNDKEKCYKATELVKKYKCENNYVLNSDNTCTGLVIIETTVSYYCGERANVGGYRYDDTDKKCYYENGIGLHEFTKEQCEEKNFVYSNGLNRCFLSKIDADITYSCPNGWSRQGNETCEKYETIKAIEYDGCDEGYTLNSSKDSCIKTISSTIKE